MLVFGGSISAPTTHSQLLCIGLEAFSRVGLPNLIIFIGDQVGGPRAEFLEGQQVFRNKNPK